MDFKSIFVNENDKFDNINYWSNQYMLPTALVMGIIAQESGFNSLAKRYEPKLNTSSYGLTQILYTTAKDYGFTGDQDNLFDDNVNLKFGLKYLKKQYALFPTKYHWKCSGKEAGKEISHRVKTYNKSAECVVKPVSIPQKRNE